jgi:hypothetical protein
MPQFRYSGILARTAFALLFVTVAHQATAATNIVTTTADDNSPGTLRRTISDSAPGDTVIFAPGLSSTTILLTNGSLYLQKSLNIDASALPAGIQINGNHQGCVFLIYYLEGTNVLTGLTITNGNAMPTDYGLPFNGDGGGIFNYVTLTLNRCTVAGNTAVPWPVDGLRRPGQGGGGIANLGTMTLNDCTISGNSAAGGAVFNGGLLTVNNSTFSGNVGYAVENGQSCLKYCGPSSSLVIVNQSTLSGNAGGISSVSTNAVIINQSTISGNSGAGLAGLFTVTNSIVAGNGSTGGTLANSINNVLGGAPNLSPLGSYGGPTQTMPPLPSSPAIDACTNGTSFTSDQRGFPRPTDGNGDSIAVADIGAVEGVAYPDGPGVLSGVKKLGNGTFQFGFPHYSGRSFTVLAGTNLASPFDTWSNLGAVVEMPAGSGQYQFTDPEATNNPQRFYRVHSP